MKISKRLVWGFEALALVLLVWTVVGIFRNAESLSAVTVSLNDGGVEHRDKVILGVGKEDEPPDYRLRVGTKQGWRDLGTFGNTWIGEGIEFVARDNVPLYQVIEVQLLDDDKLESDLLEQFPFEGNSHTGNNYAFELSTKKDIESGFAWFFNTPVGIAILTGITIAVVIIVLSYL